MASNSWLPRFGNLTNDPIESAERKLAGLCPVCGSGTELKTEILHLKRLGSTDKPVNQIECSSCYYIYSREVIDE